ncbi:class I SAM-dependent methyltransferase [Solitalea lacus]|uniref:class I SAM-dependent methyltransferase n=1 Tax=Solitalea lacus TaxID=2911172 RepID=UPI001EDBB48F|nr:class I SAM-dependent methyltransferase [Solitalea lacus]UKJ05916.1 class I SAM-dependent methyltransferase [Solitalea lacus]
MSYTPPQIDFYASNTNFDKLYPPKMQQLSGKHFTPMAVAVKAATYLVEGSGVKILDIGSGVGKFCLIAANRFPEIQFYGVENRKDLIDYAEEAKETLMVKNAHFILSDFAKINFSNFDHFYFYNSFFENLVEDEDHLFEGSLGLSGALYERYTNVLHTIFKNRPLGTKIVTYQSSHHEIPSNYQLVESHFNSKLNFWVKG